MATDRHLFFLQSPIYSVRTIQYSRILSRFVGISNSNGCWMTAFCHKKIWLNEICFSVREVWLVLAKKRQQIANFCCFIFQYTMCAQFNFHKYSSKIWQLLKRNWHWMTAFFDKMNSFNEAQFFCAGTLSIELSKNGNRSTALRICLLWLKNID